MNSNLVWAQIDLNAIKHNIAALKQSVKKNIKFMAVVKADAYGHGACEVAKACLEANADFLGVARLEEALSLREKGIKAPILIFGYIFPENTKTLHNLDLTATVYDFNMAKAFSDKALEQDIKIRVHLKVDTGMGRVGLLLDENDSIEQVKKITQLKGIELKGIYTHFAAADSLDRSYTENQIALFDSFLSDLEKNKINPGLRHAANSAGIIYHPDSHYDMVRAGISLYGLYPSDEVDKNKIDLKPAMSLKAIVTSVRKVSKNFKISYGMTYKTDRATTIASVPIGYADGYSRLLSSKGFMLVNGKKAPIVGRICMDQTMIEAGHIHDIKVGDEVVLIGQQGKKEIHADEIAKELKSINYEIVSSLTARVPKCY